MKYSHDAERERAAKQKLHKIMVKAKAKLDYYEAAHPDLRQPDSPLLASQQHENAQYIFTVIKYGGGGNVCMLYTSCNSCMVNVGSG